MAGNFSTRKALRLLAASVAEKMPYISNAESLFPQSEMKGKKYGMSVHGYLPDAGSVNDGLVAKPDKAHQVEVTAYVKNKNTAVEVDLWDEFTNIEDFKKEIVDKRSGKLAREVQLDIIGENVYRSVQAVVTDTANLAMLGEAAAKLDELSVDGEKVDFQTPTVFSTIGDASLKNFLPSATMDKIYGERNLGKYHTAGQVELVGLPILNTTGADAAPTISAEVVKDASNNVIGLKPISTITGSGTGSLIKGVPYKLSGLKIVDESGIETAQDYIVIVNEEVQYDADGNAQTVQYIPEIRITVDGKGYGNPNAHISAAAIAAVTVGTTATFELSLADVEAGHLYQIGQCRTIKALSFDQYRFDDLPAAKIDSVGTYGNLTLKMQSGNQLLNGVNCLRIDLPWCAKLFEPRKSITTYLDLGSAS